MPETPGSSFWSSSRGFVFLAVVMLAVGVSGFARGSTLMGVLGVILAAGALFRARQRRPR